MYIIISINILAHILFYHHDTNETFLEMESEANWGQNPRNLHDLRFTRGACPALVDFYSRFIFDRIVQF